jgi:hypothetical protein
MLPEWTVGAPELKPGTRWAGMPDETYAITQYDAEVGGFESASLQVNFGMILYAEAEASMNCSPAR